MTQASLGHWMMHARLLKKGGIFLGECESRKKKSLSRLLEPGRVQIVLQGVVVVRPGMRDGSTTT